VLRAEALVRADRVELGDEAGVQLREKFLGVVHSFVGRELVPDKPRISVWWGDRSPWTGHSRYAIHLGEADQVVEGERGDPAQVTRRETVANEFPGRAHVLASIRP